MCKSLMTIKATQIENTQGFYFAGRGGFATEKGMKADFLL